MFGTGRKELRRQLEEERRKNAELAAWKTQTQKYLDRGYVQQMELAGEIMTSIRRSTAISNSAFGMLKRMDNFETAFGGAAHDVAQIDKQTAELVESILTTGSAINQSSAAVEQISASIARISEESTTRFEDIRNLAALSKSGQAEMDSTLAVIKTVTAGISDLTSFLEIIDDIAGKTAILSMNAAIQAAHAGEVGKGFAVVADEIRRLADSSAANASGIAKRLNGLIEVIHRAETSSHKTAQILTEAEVKVSKATASFQEIEQGARELALGGREILQGITALKETASTMAEVSRVIAVNTGAITGRIEGLRGESQQIEGAIQAVRKDTADLSGSGLTLSQTTVKQLAVSRDFARSGSGLDYAFVSILILQQLAWVTRVRGVLDGTFQADASDYADHHHCDFGKWLDGAGKQVLGDTADYRKVYALHEQMHAQTKLTVTHFATPGRQEEAEKEFPKLVELAESVIAGIRLLASQSGDTQAFLPWSRDYEFGLPGIDAQHRRLVDLINRLFSALLSGEGRQILEGILAELVDYTKTHFKDEEQQFLPSAYLGKKEHLAQHQQFIRTVDQVQADFLAGKVVMGSETLDFLKDWLLGHINGTDRGYVRFLKANA